MGKYYLINHDIDGIEKHLTWIWRTKERYLKDGHPQLNNFNIGDKYIMYAYVERYKGHKLTKITGVFEVIQKAKRIEKKYSDRGWYVKGKPINNIKLPVHKGKRLYYVNISPTLFYEKNKFHNQLAVPLTKSEFNKIVEGIKNYRIVEDWGVLKEEPMNEQGVVALFSHYCLDLGFKIEEIRTKFPDAVVIKGNRKYTVEFEFNSGRYKSHKKKKVSYIVCWQHNWKGAEQYAKEGVIELRTELIKNNLVQSRKLV